MHDRPTGRLGLPILENALLSTADSGASNITLQSVVFPAWRAPVIRVTGFGPIPLSAWARAVRGIVGI